LKIAFDENVPIAMVKVFQTFANERQLKRKIGAFEITSATQYTPKPTDDDYLKKNDVPWIKRFAAAGGRVIISGDTEMRHVPHERLALIQAGMLVFFFDGKWSQWDFFRKCSLLIHHWPAIANRIKRGKSPTFWHIPLSWHEKAKLRKVSTDDPKMLKLEHRATPKRPARRSPATKKVESPPPVRDLTLFDLMAAPAKER
jgi:PIN like domain